MLNEVKHLSAGQYKGWIRPPAPRSGVTLPSPRWGEGVGCASGEIPSPYVLREADPVAAKRRSGLGRRAGGEGGNQSYNYPMNTKLVMIASALFLGLVGLLCLFLPDLMLFFFESDSRAAQPLVQMLGGALFAFAILNWTSKDSLLGGIYGRGTVLGNFTLFAIGAITLGKSLLNYPGNLVGWGMLIGYALFAIAFGLLLFGRAEKAKTA